ncbi:transposase [Kribbella sp. NPDC051586]|uniref:transposase n=1 Tax=Kribbella sp. NPDC051586 TaxID=3364118 RepID=UPI0037B7ADDC
MPGSVASRVRRRTPAGRPGRSARATPPKPRTSNVGDITYLSVADGNNLHLATVIDCHSRRLASWALSDHMRTELVTDALKPHRPPAAASPERSSAATTDRSSKDYARHCHELSLTQSMGAVGTSADNSLAEAFNATLKREVLQDNNTWPDPSAA